MGYRSNHIRAALSTKNDLAHTGYPHLSWETGEVGETPNLTCVPRLRVPLGRGQAPNLIPGPRKAKSRFEGLVDPFSGTRLVLQVPTSSVNRFALSVHESSLITPTG
jgi:hypothetical protein